MLQHILVIALFISLVGGLQWLLKRKAGTTFDKTAEEEAPIKKAV
jgi:cbb3-type cytochrome oxidase subunit 3